MLLPRDKGTVTHRHDMFNENRGRILYPNDKFRHCGFHLSFVLFNCDADSCRGVCSNGGMILTGETEVPGEKHYTAWVVDGDEYGAMVELY